MRKRTIAIIGIVALAATISLFFVLQMYRVTSLENFQLLTLVPVETYSSEQVKDIQQEVCGKTERDDWIPGRVNFAYLQPSETLHRIPCNQSPAGSYSQDFYFDQNGDPVIVDVQNRHLMFNNIDTAEKAAEYAFYFGVLDGSEIGSSSLILAAEAYREAGQCGQLRSPVEKLTVTTIDGNQNYEVELNFFQLATGSVQYAKYLVSRDGELELLRDEGLAHCGFMS